MCVLFERFFDLIQFVNRKSPSKMSQIATSYKQKPFGEYRYLVTLSAGSARCCVVFCSPCVNDSHRDQPGRVCGCNKEKYNAISPGDSLWPPLSGLRPVPRPLARFAPIRTVRTLSVPSLCCAIKIGLSRIAPNPILSLPFGHG